MSRRRKKRNRKKVLSTSRLFETFTKLWVTVLLIVAVIDLQLTYVLALLNRSEIAETLSVAIVTEIIGVIAVYMIKSFLETSNEKKHLIELKKLNLPDEEIVTDGEDVLNDIDDTASNEENPSEVDDIDSVG